MKKGNYILDEQLLGVPHSLFSTGNGYENREFLLFVNSTTDLDLKAYNFKGIGYFKQCIGQGLNGEDFYEQVMHPEDYPLFLHFMRSCESLEEGKEKETTVRLRSPFGYWKKFRFRSRLYSGFGMSTEKYVLSLATAVDPYKAAFRRNKDNSNIETEKNLQESINRYRVLINSLDDGFSVIELIFDTNNKPIDYLFVELNPAFEQHIHLSNPLGRTIKELSPEHDSKWFEIYSEIVFSGEALRFEEYAKDLRSWFDIYAFPIGSKKSRRVAILCSDITHRKEAEQRLKRANEELEEKVQQRTAELEEKNDLLQMVFDTVNQGIFILEPVYGNNGSIVDFKYVRVNKKIKRYYRLENLKGRSFLQLNPQAIASRAFEIFKQTLLTGKSKDFEVCFKRGGKDNWFKMSTRRQEGLLINSLENVTNKKQRAKKLKDNIRFKKQLINTSPDIILIFNLYEEKVRYMNRDLSENTGHAEDVVGMPLLDLIPLIHPQDREKAMEFHNQLMKASDKDVFEIEFRLKGENGHWDFYNARGKVFMRNKKGNPYEYIVLLRNVQEQKKTREALLDAEKLSIKGEIARTLAHELRNPLASIGMSADILHQRVDLPRQQELLNYVDIIKRSTNRLNSLVTDLLSSSNYSPAVLKKCCLAETMDEVLDQAQDRIYLAGIQVNKNYKAPRFILADKEKLKIALLNIVVNASEAMIPNEGILTLDIIKDPENFTLRINDNGCGMDKEQVENLFETFYTQKAGGLGIGLSSVKNILHEHHATVSVESEPEKGTSFSLTFPRLDQESGK